MHSYTLGGFVFILCPTRIRKMIRLQLNAARYSDGNPALNLGHITDKVAEDTLPLPVLVCGSALSLNFSLLSHNNTENKKEDNCDLILVLSQAWREGEVF